MKKLIILLFLIPFIVLALFFLSFSSYSEDDGCVVLLNSFKEGVVFDDIVFLEADNAEKCNKNNTLILYTLKGGDVLKFAEPQKIRKGRISFFVSSILPEQRGDDLPAAQGEQRESAETLAQEGNTAFRIHQPGKDSDFIIYYLYNNPDSSFEELDDAFKAVQEKPVDLILTGDFKAPKGSIIRPNLSLFNSSKKPETGVLIFSVIRLENGEKKVLLRSFNRRIM